MLSFEGLFLTVPLWSLLLVTLVALLYLYGTRTFQVWKELGITGPRPFPFFGNVLEMFDTRSSVRECIDRWQKRYGRTFGIYVFDKPGLVITDPGFVKQVLVKDFSNFTDRFLMGDLQQPSIDKSVFFASGADWRRLRRIISPVFSNGKLKMLIHHMNLTAARLGKKLQQLAVEEQFIDAKTVFGDFTLDVVCGTTFGLDTNAQENLKHPFIEHAKSLIVVPKTLQILIVLIGMFPIFGTLCRKLGIGFFNISDATFFEKNISTLIEEKKLQGGQKYMDFLQLLIDAEANNTDECEGEKKLTSEEIIAQGIIFIIGAYESTSVTLQFLSYELAKNQDVQKAVIEEIKSVFGDSTEVDYEKCKNLKYTKATINETLRLHPPNHLLSRKAEHASCINGVIIPANSVIHIPIGNISRDPEFFSDSESFKPERFLNDEIDPFTFMPFGQGPRICIGMRLAIMEIKIALVHALRQVRFVAATPEVLEVEDYTGVLIPKIPIRLRVQTAS